MSWFSDAIDSVGDALSDAGDAIVDVVSDAAEDVADAAEDIADDVSDTWSDVVDSINQGVEEGGFLGGVVAMFTGVVGGIIATVGSAIDFVCDFVGAVVGGIVGLVGTAIGAILRVTILVLSGGTLKDFAKDVGTFFSDGARALGGWISDGFNLLGDLVERVFDFGAGVLMRIGSRIICFLGKLGSLFEPTRSGSNHGVGRIDHFFVLVMENRSFDHLLGRLGSPGVDGIDPTRDVNLTSAGAAVHAGGDAKLKLAADPPHEFSNVQRQLQGVNAGFIQEFEATMQAEFPLAMTPEDASEVMRGFDSSRLPILNTLAREFAVCDKWFSSLPGPTLANRLFALAGTSGGLADSPSSASMVWAMTGGGFEFDRGNIFDAIRGKCLDWRVYAGDATPLVMTLKGMATEYALSAGRAIRSTNDFASDLAGADSGFPCFTFIEPSYGQFWSTYEGGSSQHPLDVVWAGEFLIKDVYEALRSSPIWETSALIIFYDEHGGFFDHVVPPAAVPPGDGRDYETWADDPNARAFQFDRLGVRVPAVVVSPLVPRGTVDSMEFDHTSVLATLIQRFGLRWLTERSNRANRLDHLFSLREPRTDTPLVLPAPFTG